MNAASAAPRRADLDAAIDWMVLLRSGEATEQDRTGLDHWRAADPRHDAAWQRVSGSVQNAAARLPAAPPADPQHRLLIDTLGRARPLARRKLLVQTLALAGIGLGTALVAHRASPLQGLLADAHTGTGERRRIALPDGSTLELNARTAVDIRFDGQQRLVRLHAGELIATVAPDRQRPFVVQSDDGTVQALGTRFLVAQPGDGQPRSLALVLEHTVAVRTAQGREAVLRQGEAAWFGPEGIERTEIDVRDRAAWQNGLLVVRDRPLAEVVQALRPYRRGWIRLSPAAAQVRVLGAYPLDDTDAALQALADTLPIRVARHSGGWLVRIDTATP